MYAMTGFRIGWAVGNKELIRAMTNIQSQETSGPATPSQWAAVGALNGVQSSIESLRLTLENNRNVMVARLQAIPGREGDQAGRHVLLLPGFQRLQQELAEAGATSCWRRCGWSPCPGKEFGMEGHLRVSFCGTHEGDHAKGIERIQWALDPNAPNELYLGDRKLVRDWV